MLLCALQGDSWTIAFHEAEDAVAFSLQVSLHEQEFVEKGALLCYGYTPCVCATRISGRLHKGLVSDASLGTLPAGILAAPRRHTQHKMQRSCMHPQ